MRSGNRRHSHDCRAVSQAKGRTARVRLDVSEAPATARAVRQWLRDSAFRTTRVPDRLAVALTLSLSSWTRRSRGCGDNRFTARLHHTTSRADAEAVLRPLPELPANVTMLRSGECRTLTRILSAVCCSLMQGAFGNTAAGSKPCTRRTVRVIISDYGDAANIKLACAARRSAQWSFAVCVPTSRGAQQSGPGNVVVSFAVTRGRSDRIPPDPYDIGYRGRRV